MVRIRVASVVLALLLAAPEARAETAPPLTAEQSASLARALRLWTLGLMDEATGFTATPAEGHYDLRIPVDGAIGESGLKLEGSPLTAQASLGGDGRWHFDAITLPSPLRLLSGDQVWTTETMQEQHASAVVDPTLATASTGDSARVGVRLRTEASKAQVVTTIAHSATHQEWVPASPGRADVASVTHAEDIAVRNERPAGEASPPGIAPDGVTVRSVTVGMQASNADMDRASRLIRQGVIFAAGLGRNEELTAEQRTALHALLALTRDLARESRQSIVAEGIATTAGERAVTIDRLALTQRIAAPDGKLDVHMRLELDGLGVPGLPMAIRDLVPRKIVFAPFMTGLPVEDVYAAAEQAIDEKGGRAAVAGDAKNRLANMQSTAGLEELAFDLGPATVSATGQLSGASDSEGTAVVQAVGLDALIRRASGDPLLKQAVPVLIFLKGIGDQNGDKVVWRLGFKKGRLTVNGTDISGLIPSR